ncbi:uncharacterized protein LOC143250944 [Tachypleus tridentatus]|uniref:uncharacterized protein LOC143250944 n=1 Tax=Tachypleus tridentatus TaxID=6853 RepID=UPI003FD4AFCB
MVATPRFVTSFIVGMFVTSFLLELAHPYPTNQGLDLKSLLLKDVAAKRSTIMLNKLMSTLQKALREDEIVSDQMELQRRGGEHKFWRCYFNAVSCFRRK